MPVGSPHSREALFHIGWDVGAWNCDRNKESRDALVILADHGIGKPQRAGACAGLNLRSELNDQFGCGLITAFLRRCGVDPERPVRTIAVDTPLGWPAPMRALLATGYTANVPLSADQNPYLFRQTELERFKHKHRPLSAVRDMIGSQSTKGIYFLARVGASRSAVGLWEINDNTGEEVSIIETYPAPCRKSSLVCAIVDEIARDAAAQRCFSRHPRFTVDLEDALRCAVVAWLYSNDTRQLKSPPHNIPLEEGWIWIPEEATCGRGGGPAELKPLDRSQESQNEWTRS
jgi:hypothetical protein